MKKETNKIFFIAIAILIILTIIITLIGANKNKTIHRTNNTEFYEIIEEIFRYTAGHDHGTFHVNSSLCGTWNK